MDFQKRFNQNKDNLEGVFGKNIMEGYVVKTNTYKSKSDTDRKQTIKDIVFNQWYSYVYLKNSDTNKYGSVKKNFAVTVFTRE